MKTKINRYVGINVQWPISELILSGEKTIETRTYPLPEKYLNIDLVMIETPGKDGKFKARSVALIKISKCFQYANSKNFYSDYKLHRVSKDSPWSWSNEKPKWAWKIEVIKKIKPKTVTQKGIIYRKNIQI